jgi:hypothetical protein
MGVHVSDINNCCMVVFANDHTRKISNALAEARVCVGVSAHEPFLE